MASRLSISQIAARVFLLAHRNIHGLFFYTVVALLAALGLSMIYAPHRFEALFPFIQKAVFDELGKAFLIAAILAGSVDIYMKRRLLMHFLRDVSPFIEGLGLPREFQDEIRFIRTISVYRQDYEVSYTITPIPGKAGYVYVDMFHKFDAVNQSDRSQLFHHRLSSETEHQQIGPTEILFAGAKGPDAKYSFSKEENNFGDTIERTSDAVVFEKESYISHGVQNHETNTFWAKIRTVSEENDADTLFFTMPTLKPEVTVEYPPDFEVDVYFGHRYQDENPDAILKAPEPPARPTVWQLPGACLTWHAVTISWKRKTPVQTVLPGTEQGSAGTPQISPS